MNDLSSTTSEYCDGLPDSGGPALVLLTLAGCFLAMGLLLLFLGRTRRATTPVVCLMLFCGGIFATGNPQPTQAVTSDCPTQGADQGGHRDDRPGRSGSDTPLTITQTSTKSRLGPEIKPKPITGRVVNNAKESTFVDAITVNIVSVTKAPGAAPGTCDASDYILLARQMPVEQILSPYGSANFAGASIGFRNKQVNQDACKGATVNLQYVSS